jgi:Bacterial PH domain
MRVRPAISCNTLGVAERIRVPSPAASTMTAAGLVAVMGMYAPCGNRLVCISHIDWAEIVEVNLREGDPWVYLDLADGSVLPAMGLQAADGEHCRTMARELRTLVRARTQTSRND